MRRENSLKSKRDFLRLYKQGRTSVDKVMVVYAIKGEENVSRVGFSISKKIGNAVTRNRIKRKLREIFRSRYKQFNNVYDLVIVVRRKSVYATYQTLDKVFLKHCFNLNLIESDKGDD